MMRRRRMGRPGLIGTMARTAVVAGTATAVVGGVKGHQEKKQEEQAALADQQQQQAYAAQQQQAPPPQDYAPAPAPAAEPATDPLERLQQLADMKEQGLLTEDEFTAMKAKVIGA